MSTDFKTEYSANKNVNTLDRGSYNDFGDGTPARQVLLNKINNFAPSKDVDAITASCPDAVTEVFEYRQGGLTGTILNTVTVIYTDATKECLLSVEAV